MAVLLLAIGCSYYFALPSNFRSFRSELPSGYYGALTEAFLAGQLHLNIPVDPKLLTLENPYAGPQGANRPHDMSYYRGRFYLYYGAAPVIFLYLPWRVLTGGYLGESVGMVMMLYGGVILGAGWLVSVRRRWFPELSFGWVLVLVAGLGFGAPCFPTATNNTFYAVPIASAFLCLMAAFTAATRALSRPGLGAQAGWLALASLFWGLAVGCRPIYVAGLTALVVPAWYLWVQVDPAQRWRWPGLRLLAATVVPAALIGLAIMTYNYLRFDSPFDFGIRFTMATEDVREARQVGLEYIGKNLRLYLLTTVTYIRYFPFLVVDANTWGLLPHLPFAALGALFPLTWLHRPLRESRWILPGLLLAGAAAGNFGLLCLFFGGEERYMLDFAPPLLLLAAITALALLQWAARLASRVGAAVIRGSVGGLLAFALAHGLMLAVPRFGSLPPGHRLERLVNTPTALLEQWTGTKHGPVELELIFPRNRFGLAEPLVATGLGDRSGDGVMVHYLDPTHVQFSAFHVGRGGPVSEPIEIDYAVPHRLRIELGSLYPPAGHPLFADWTPAETARIRRRLKIDFDGRTVLQGNFQVYPSVPSGVLVGQGHLPADVSSPVFTGRINHQQRPGLARSEAAGFEGAAGPVRLTVRFPLRVGDEGLPLVATGHPEKGDLLFVRLQADGQLRFGHDSLGAGAIFSGPVPYNPAADQVIDVEMGSLYPPTPAELPASRRHRLRVALNGSTVIDTARPFNPSEAEEVEFGFNALGASTAIDYFPGTIRKIEHLPAHQPGTNPPIWGPLRLSVLLPDMTTARAEPLAITGRTGRADVVFVRYEEDGRVRFGLDHWGYGIALSEPLSFDRHQPLKIEIHSGGLLPPEANPAWTGRDPAEGQRLRRGFELLVNGRPVLTDPFVPFPNETGETAIGGNPIGASTCESNFTGQLLGIERLPW